MNLIPVKLKNKLSIDNKRLNGSHNCQNCGTDLQGPYCHYCGQPDKNFFRFFPALLREMMGDLLDLDSRLTRTLKPLLFHPGKLASDYMHGRRFRYTSPVRLYLFSSIAFFLLAGFITNLNLDDVIIDTDQSIEDSVNTATEMDAEKIVKSSVNEGENNSPSAVENEAISQPEDDEDDEDDDWNIRINGRDGKGVDTINIPFFPGSLNDWVNSELAKSEEKKAEIKADPSIITNKVFDMLPMTVFVLLPVFALLLKLYYSFSKRYYTEHLIFALYNHSFVFVLATVMILLSSGVDWFISMQWIVQSSWITTLLSGLLNLMGIWLMLYFWIAMKRFYQQGWAMTTLKFITVGFSYTIVLAFATAAVALLSFLLI